MADKNDILADKILSSIEPDILTGIQADATEEEAPLTENYPQPDASYSHKDTLTLEVDGAPVTRRLNDWVRYDPVTLHKAMGSVPFLIARDDYRILMSTLRANNIEYYRRAVGLDILVDITGKGQEVAAKSLYNYEPTKFYKWWSSHENKVYMTTREKIQLFLKVESIKSGTLLKKHVELMNNLRMASKKQD